MSTALGTPSGGGAAERPPAPPFPATSAEFVNTLAHFHRAEIGRMAGWRDRIDQTSNWAITVVAGMLSVSLSTPAAHHGVLLFAMLLVLLLLWIEARRYRFFDVYRARVRRLERHYFAQVFAPVTDADPEWARALAQDLRAPRFLISPRAAMARRLRRNYLWMFLVLLLAWLLKVSSLPSLQPEGAPQAGAPQAVLAMAGGMALGPIPGWVVLLCVLAFYGCLLGVTLSARLRAGELAHGEVHV
jgi:uncharacterized membrane protein